MPSVDINKLHMSMAHIMKNASYAKRNKVGAIITKETRIVSTGYNGMPSGMNNKCEFNEFPNISPFSGVESMMENFTKPEVVHAEANAILFAARNGLSTKGCTLYVTLSPCIECAKMIIQSGIEEVYFSERYRDSSGLELLLIAGVKSYKL